MIIGFLFFTLSLPALLSVKHWQVQEEWQQISYGLRSLPGKGHIPAGQK